MVDIPILGRVECVDGPCGTAAQVIIDFEARTITHVVVALDGSPTGEHRVPVSMVVETTPELVRLSCTRQELSRNGRGTRPSVQVIEPAAGSQALPGARRAAA